MSNSTVDAITASRIGTSEGMILSPTPAPISSATAPDDFVDALVWHTDRAGQSVLRHAGGQEKLFEQHLARVSRLAVGWNADHGYTLISSRPQTISPS